MNPDLAAKAQAGYAQQAEEKQEQASHDEVLIGLDRVQGAVVKGAIAQIQALEAHEPTIKRIKGKVEVANPTDIAPLVQAIKAVEKATKTKKTDFTPLANAIRSLTTEVKKLPDLIEVPEPLEEVQVTNLNLLYPYLEDIVLSIKAWMEVERQEQPINVEAPVVNVAAPDFTSLQKSLADGLKSVQKSIADNKVVIPADDDTAIIQGLQDVKDTIAAIRFPVPNVVTDPLVAYKVADVDDAGTVKYYGQIANDGRWVIMKEDDSASPKTYRYAAGSASYPTNWTNRASLTYDYLYNAING